MPSVNKITSKASNRKKKKIISENLCNLWENWNKREQSQACLGYAERRQFLERSEKIIFPCNP